MFNIAVCCLKAAAFLTRHGHISVIYAVKATHSSLYILVSTLDERCHVLYTYVSCYLLKYYCLKQSRVFPTVPLELQNLVGVKKEKVLYYEVFLIHFALNY